MRRGGPDILRWVSITLILAAVVLFFFELISYSRQRARLPAGMILGGVPVGGLDSSAALQRLLQAYSSPVELHYGDQIILLNPASVGFRLDSEAMLAAAESVRTGTDFWSGFWDFLWNRPGDPVSIPVRAEYSRGQLETVLSDIAARYDEPPTPSQPIPGSPNFDPGQPGRVLDVARAADLVGEVLTRAHNRRVNLPVVASAPPRPSLASLETLLKQNIDVAGFDGLAAIYLLDLRSGRDLHFLYYQGEDIAADPDIAFTAASINKVAIMVAFYRYFDAPFDPEAEKWLREMITQSGNGPSDWLMERIDRLRGPLMVTETMQELGLESTFIAGYFRLGAELLRVYRTPGNQRPDLNTRPDVYNQTTAAEMGMLLGDIYLCAQGKGNLLAVFPDEIRPSECQAMLDLLAQNRIGVLLEAGVPEGTRVAHKHGWTTSPLSSLGDAGVIYSPGGNYVLSVFLWDDPEMIWEPTSKLVADLSRAVYNYFNPP